MFKMRKCELLLFGGFKWEMFYKCSLGITRLLPELTGSRTRNSFQSRCKTNDCLPVWRSWRGASILQVQPGLKLLAYSLSGWNGDFFSKEGDALIRTAAGHGAKTHQILDFVVQRFRFLINLIRSFSFTKCRNWLKLCNLMLVSF